MDVVVAVPLTFFFLAEFPESLSDSSFISSIFIRLCAESVSGSCSFDSAHLACITALVAAALESLSATGGSVGHGGAVWKTTGPAPGAAETLPAILGEFGALLALFGLGAGAATGFLQGEGGAAAEAVAGGEEAFAGVAFEEEGLVLVAELVPEGVKVSVVGAVDDVGEFVEHRVCDLLAGEEEGSVAWVAEAEEDFLAAVDVEALVEVSVRAGRYRMRT